MTNVQSVIGTLLLNNLNFVDFTHVHAIRIVTTNVTQRYFWWIIKCFGASCCEIPKIRKISLNSFFLTVIIVVIDNYWSGFLLGYSMHSISLNFGTNFLGGDVIEVDYDNCVAFLSLNFLQVIKIS